MADVSELHEIGQATCTSRCFRCNLVSVKSLSVSKLSFTLNVFVWLSLVQKFEYSSKSVQGINCKAPN